MIAQIPNEMLLEFFHFFPLKSLISARGVNQKWRRLVPLAHLIPARRALLDLYDTVIKSPVFLSSRDVVLSNTLPFDREAYLDSLLREHCAIPDEFYFWLMEWPSAAAFGWTHPILNAEHNRKKEPWRPFGMNCLSVESASIRECEWMSDFALHVNSFPAAAPRYKKDWVALKAILVWAEESHFAMLTWLIIDDRPHCSAWHGKLCVGEGEWDANPIASGWVDWLTRKRIVAKGALED